MKIHYPSLFCYKLWFIWLWGFFGIWACEHTQQPKQANESVFIAMPTSHTGIRFSNDVEYTEDYNIYTYRNFYNGAGIGIGDINNDGLPDLYFCGNLVDNRLYLNKGNFVFEDITEKAGVACPDVWSSGVSMADINGDGWLDIYVCKSGDPNGENRHNELFINNGDLSFTEMSAEYGLNDLGLSTHAVFFDFDRDGDLDCYLLNNSLRSVGGYDLRPGQRNRRDPEGGNKLLRNDQGKFVDISHEAGIYGSDIGFGLGVTIGDINKDGWPDIYVSNDFFEKDYLYINNQNGTFTECLEKWVSAISLGSMGADMADINNDGLPDIFVTDMLPEREDRIKSKMTFDSWDKYQLVVENGYYHQFTRNVLQLNRGNGNFSEIGRLAGVAATDWSWGALMADFNNDGLKDIFVANGIYKDLMDQDYVNFMANPVAVRQMLKETGKAIKAMVDMIPSEPLPNYLFVNQGNLQFTNQAAAWGLGTPSFSNGSAYSDLDNDGDLDLVVNNVNMPPFVYQNQTRQQQPNRNFLRLELKGEGLNTFALGAKATAFSGSQIFYLELSPMRGFQSCTDPRLLFGLGEVAVLDSLVVDWPDGRQARLYKVEAGQNLVLHQADAGLAVPSVQDVPAPMLVAVAAPGFQHVENKYADFDRDRLLFHMLSTEGPKLAVGDINGDGLSDFFIGGAKDSPGAVYVQLQNGTFRQLPQPALEADRTSEDLGAVWLDANADGHPDLFVCSGGNELSPSSSALFDRLYFNDGQGMLVKAPHGHLPGPYFESTSVAKAHDFDGDGLIDLFVGTRLMPFQYGLPASGYLWRNEGNGKFKDVTQKLAPELMQSGLITDAAWSDYDGDGLADLVVCGEWMPVRIFRNEGTHFVEVTEMLGLAASKGWWNTLQVADINHDGRPDLLVGNHGLNSRFKATTDKPVRLYYGDFDGNGSPEQVIATYNGQESYPMALLHDLVKQMPGLRKRYLKYENYKAQPIGQVLGSAVAKAHILEANELRSGVFINKQDGFHFSAFPVEAQFSPVYAILAGDFDQDGKPDLLLGGNLHDAKPEVGRYDASLGLVLTGDGKGNFVPQGPQKSGFHINGCIRAIIRVPSPNGDLILVALNNGPLQAFCVKSIDQ